jgi:hypothetical protein
MVKAAEYWNGHNVVVVRNVVPFGLEFDCLYQKPNLAGNYSARGSAERSGRCDL